MTKLRLPLVYFIGLVSVRIRGELTGEDLQINLTQTSDLTNGRTVYQLTCAAPGLATSEYSWFAVNCAEGGKGNTCTLISLPAQEFIEPACAVRHEKQLTQLYFRINVTYPQLQPLWLGSEDFQVLQSGDVVTCAVPTLNPLLGTVHFACVDPPLPDQADVRNDSWVTSSVTVDTAQVTERDSRCVCQATLDIGQGFYHLTTAALFAIEHKGLVKTLTLNDTNKEMTVNGQDNVTLPLVCEAFGRPRPTKIGFQKLGFNGTLANATVTETANWTSEATVTLSDIQCHDMGTYSCAADNGVGQPDTRNIKLNVRCPPKSLSNDTLNMTTDGIDFTLEAYPSPDDFGFTYLGNGESNEIRAVASNMFSSTCQQDDDIGYLARCRIRPKEIPKGLLGLYRVRVSNGLGSAEVAFQIRTVVRRKESQTGLVVGLVIVIIVVVIVACIIFFKKRRYFTRANRRVNAWNRTNVPDVEVEEDVEFIAVDSNKRENGTTEGTTENTSHKDKSARKDKEASEHAPVDKLTACEGEKKNIHGLEEDKSGLSDEKMGIEAENDDAKDTGSLKEDQVIHDDDTKDNDAGDDTGDKAAFKKEDQNILKDDLNDDKDDMEDINARKQDQNNYKSDTQVKEGLRSDMENKNARKDDTEDNGANQDDRKDKGVHRDAKNDNTTLGEDDCAKVDQILTGSYKGDTDTDKDKKSSISTNKKSKKKKESPKPDNDAHKHGKIGPEVPKVATTKEGAGHYKNIDENISQDATSAQAISPIKTNETGPAGNRHLQESSAQSSAHHDANEEPIYNEIDDDPPVSAPAPAPALAPKKKGRKVEGLYAVTPCYGTPGYQSPVLPVKPPQLPTPRGVDAFAQGGRAKGGDVPPTMPPSRTETAAVSEVYNTTFTHRPPPALDDTYNHIHD